VLPKIFVYTPEVPDFVQYIGKLSPSPLIAKSDAVAENDSKKYRNVDPSPPPPPYYVDQCSGWLVERQQVVARGELLQAAVETHTWKERLSWSSHCLSIKRQSARGKATVYTLDDETLNKYFVRIFWTPTEKQRLQPDFYKVNHKNLC
jgi:hypothetical protein